MSTPNYATAPVEESMYGNFMRTSPEEVFDTTRRWARTPQSKIRDARNLEHNWVVICMITFQLKITEDLQHIRFGSLLDNIIFLRKWPTNSFLSFFVFITYIFFYKMNILNWLLSLTLFPPSLTRTKSKESHGQLRYKFGVSTKCLHTWKSGASRKYLKAHKREIYRKRVLSCQMYV